MKYKYIGIEKKEARWGFAFTVPAILFLFSVLVSIQLLTLYIQAFLIRGSFR